MKNIILTLRDVTVALVAIAGSIAAAFKVLLPTGSEMDREWRSVFVLEFILLELIVLICAGSVIILLHRWPALRKWMFSTEARTLWPLSSLGVTEPIYRKLPLCALVLGLIAAFPWGYTYAKSAAGYYRHWRDESYNAYLRRNLSIVEHSFDLRSAKNLSQLLTRAELREDYRAVAESKVRAYDGLLRYLGRLSVRMAGPAKNEKDQRPYVFLCSHLIWLDPRNPQAPEAYREVEDFIRATERLTDKLCAAVERQNVNEIKKLSTGECRLVFDELLASQIEEQSVKTIQDLLSRLAKIDSNTLRLHLERVNGLPALRQISADYLVISRANPTTSEGRHILADMQRMRGDMVSALKIEGKDYKPENLPNDTSNSVGGEGSGPDEGDPQRKFFEQQTELVTFSHFKSFVEHCHPADLLADGCLVNFIEWCTNHQDHTTSREEQKQIQADISRKICGMLATLARSTGEKTLVEALRLAMCGGPRGIPMQKGADPQTGAEENSQLAFAVRRALKAMGPEKEPATSEEWLASVMEGQSAHMPQGFPWVNSDTTVSLSTNIDESSDNFAIDDLSKEKTSALRKALLKAERKTRFAVYPTLDWVTLFPFRTSLNKALLNEIKGADADDLRWFIFSEWLSEGWSGDVRVLDSLPALQVYLDGLPAPEKTDFLIYRRVLNLRAADERGDLEEKKVPAPDDE